MTHNSPALCTGTRVLSWWALCRSGFTQAAAAAQPHSRPDQPADGQHTPSQPGNVLYERGPICDIPEEYAARRCAGLSAQHLLLRPAALMQPVCGRERFLELDLLQPGWQVQLLGSPDGPVDAKFFSPTGAHGLHAMQWCSSLIAVWLSRCSRGGVHAGQESSHAGSKVMNSPEQSVGLVLCSPALWPGSA